MQFELNMSTPTPNTPVVNGSISYVNGLHVNAGVLNADLLSTSTLVISSGIARDSTDINDITLSATATLNTAIAGVANGLDIGVLAATTLYAVYVIADSKEYQPTATLLSASFTQPLLPFGYDMFRRIGTVLSNAAGTRILNFHQRGNGSGRDTWYAVPLPTLIVAGAAVIFTPVILTTWVPSTASEVLALSALTSDGGGTRTVVYSADGTTTIAAAATAGEVIMSSPAGDITYSSLRIPVTLAAGVVSCDYAVSNAGAAVAVSVQGFVDQL
jgi:hypothetical protein